MDPDPRRGPLLDAYATQRCPVRLQHRYDDAVEGSEERSSSLQRRVDAGRAHEQAVLASLRAALGDRLVEVAGDDREERQAASLTALASSAVAIAGAWLPGDLEGRRSGRPDLLVAGADGWLPVEIKLHLLTASGSGSLDSSTLADPRPAASEALPGLRFRKGGALPRDLLQLAHYRRMLEALDLAATEEGVLGGVIDGSERLWWVDLDGPAGSRGQGPLERYDALFAERLALVDAVVARNRDRSLPRPLEPRWHKECEGCEYEEVCRSELEERDDVSLVRWSTPDVLASLRAAGIDRREALGQVDLEVVELARTLSDSSMPIDVLLEAARQHDPETPLVDVARHRYGARRRIERSGISTVGDLLGRDPASLEVAALRDVDRLVRRARAHQAGGVVRLRHAHEIDAARADVEVDVDMESYDHATYLWGALVTCHVPVVGISEGYRAFADFERLDDEVEATIFGDFWAFLTELRQEVRRQGRSFRAYCFWRAAEEGQMRRALRAGGDDLPSPRALERFFASEEWVDLHEVVSSQLQTDGPLGLKALAGRAGFEWRDEDPSGEASMAWYEHARDGDAASRQRLLDYNEDDVRATRALRVWLDGPARALPHLDDLPGLVR